MIAITLAFISGYLTGAVTFCAVAILIKYDNRK